MNFLMEFSKIYYKNQLLYAQNDVGKKEFETFGFKNVKIVRHPTQ